MSGELRAVLSSSRGSSRGGGAERNTAADGGGVKEVRDWGTGEEEPWMYRGQSLGSCDLM